LNVLYSYMGRCSIGRFLSTVQPLETKPLSTYFSTPKKLEVTKALQYAANTAYSSTSKVLPLYLTGRCEQFKNQLYFHFLSLKAHPLHCNLGLYAWRIVLVIWITNLAHLFDAARTLLLFLSSYSYILCLSSARKARPIFCYYIVDVDDLLMMTARMMQYKVCAQYYNICIVRWLLYIIIEIIIQCKLLAVAVSS
jgi:hypothetical protein